MAKFGLLHQRFKKGDESKETPSIPTSSLPDIIFILLFFFIVITVVRKIQLQLDVSLPKASEIQKMKNRQAVAYIYIGKPSNPDVHGEAPRIQLQVNDGFSTVADIQPYVQIIKETTPPKFSRMLTFALRVDVDTKMGLVTEVKQELRKAQALKINYSAVKKE